MAQKLPYVPPLLAECPDAGFVPTPWEADKQWASLCNSHSPSPGTMPSGPGSDSAVRLG